MKNTRQFSLIENIVSASIILFIMLLIFTFSANAQDVSNNSESLRPSTKSTYKYAIGVRAGGTSGITGKVFFGNASAAEGILSIGPRWFGLTGLYELYSPAFNASGLRWYYGGGGHVMAQSDNYYWPEYKGPKGDRVGFGVDGIVGLEYKIPPIPIAISLDLKPNVGVWTNGGIGWGIDPGLGIKFAF